MAKRKMRNSFTPEAEAAKQAVLRQRGDGWEVLTWRETTAPEATHVRCWTVSVAHDTNSGLQIFHDLAIQAGPNFFMIIPGVTTIGYAEYYAPVAAEPVELAHMSKALRLSAFV